MFEHSTEALITNSALVIFLCTWAGRSSMLISVLNEPGKGFILAADIILLFALQNERCKKGEYLRGRTVPSKI